MLCYDCYDKLGQVCTNQCQKRSTCTKQRLSILIEAIDHLTSCLYTDTHEGLYVVSMEPYCSAPEAYINEVIYDYAGKNESKLQQSALSQFI